MPPATCSLMGVANEIQKIGCVLGYDPAGCIPTSALRHSQLLLHALRCSVKHVVGQRIRLRAEAIRVA